MGRSWMAVLAACFALATPTGAAELEGFGPIKFGMTMEEAYDAIEREGRLDPETDTLTYKHPLGQWGWEVDATQYFTKGRASRATARLSDEFLSRKLCILMAGRFASSISHKYGVEPIVRQNLTRRGATQIDSMFFTFGFESTATLQLIVSSIFSPEKCKFEASYFPPLQEHNPF